MKSVTCAGCGLVTWAAEGLCCKRCGSPLEGQPAAVQAPHAPESANAAPRVFRGVPTKKRKGLAVASLVIGIIAIPTLGILLVGSVTGIVLGIVALVKERNSPQEYGGKGWAVGGLVTNGLALVMAPFIGIVAAIAIPNVLASIRAANEGSAIASIRTIIEAQDTYRESNPTYGDLDQLSAQGLLDSELGRGIKHGYIFTVVAVDDHYKVSATPLKYGRSGVRSFYYSSERREIRAEDNEGQAASDDSPPLAPRGPSAQPPSSSTLPPRQRKTYRPDPVMQPES